MQTTETVQTVRDLTVTLSIFSAMLTPVILISATGSLTISTSNRFSRAIERARNLAEMIEALVKADPSGAFYEDRRRLLLNLLLLATRRSRLLHRSLTLLYVSVLMFILTSVVLGIIAITGIDHAEIALLSGGVGMLLLCASCMLLIAEARITRRAIDAEMDFTLRLGQHYAPEDLAHTFTPYVPRALFHKPTQQQ